MKTCSEYALEIVYTPRHSAKRGIIVEKTVDAIKSEYSINPDIFLNEADIIPLKLLDGWKGEQIRKYIIEFKAYCKNLQDKERRYQNERY